MSSETASPKPSRWSRLRSSIRWRLFARRHPEVARVVARVRAERLSYLDRDALVDLAEAALACERRGLAGELAEAGCALGGSAIVLAAAKRPERSLRVYDAFGMIPPPTERDGEDVHERYRKIAAGEARGIRGGRYYGYEEDLLGKVQASFAAYGLPVDGERICLVQGFYQESLTGEGPLALAHVDCDWYDSVWTCLERLAPRLVPGGLLVIDDYFRWSGCRQAVDDYFAARPRGEFRFRRRARLQIVRQ